MGSQGAKSSADWEQGNSGLGGARPACWQFGLAVARLRLLTALRHFICKDCNPRADGTLAEAHCCPQLPSSWRPRGSGSLVVAVMAGTCPAWEPDWLSTFHVVPRRLAGFRHNPLLGWPGNPGGQPPPPGHPHLWGRGGKGDAAGCCLRVVPGSSQRLPAEGPTLVPSPCLPSAAARAPDTEAVPLPQPDGREKNTSGPNHRFSGTCPSGRPSPSPQDLVSRSRCPACL